MKRIIRATIGIGATIAIIFLVERTMDSFGVFDKPEEDTVAIAQADSIKAAAEQLAKIQEKINDGLKGDDVIEIGDNSKTVKRIYKNPFFLKDEQIETFQKPDSIPETKQVVEVTFDLDESLVDGIGFLFIEGFNMVSSKPKVRYFKPRIGLNRLRLKTNFPVGKHKFQFGYCLKDDALKNTVRFYSKNFDVVID